MPDQSWSLWCGDLDAGSGENTSIRRFISPDGGTWTEQVEGHFVGLENGWEDGWVAEPTVSYHETLFYVWYVGGNHEGLGLATSPDGVTWSRADANPVFVPDKDWENGWIGAPSVVWTGDQWRLYYVAGDGAGVGVATSPDGVVWERTHDVPIIQPSGASADAASTWDRDRIVSASVSIENTEAGRRIYRMWYAGGRQRNDGTFDVGIGFAGSFDGFDFVKMAENPVLRAGGYGETDPHEARLLGTRVLIYAEFWKKDGTNRHVVSVATHTKEPVIWPKVPE